MTLHHRLEGDAEAPVLVLSHSLGTRLEVWDPQLPDLTSRFRVLLYDHPGHGRSPLPPTGATLGDLADELVGLLDDLRLERASFCGSSLGGMVGMTFATRAPERLDRLVLACSGARMGSPAGWAERAATVRSRGMGAIAEAMLERWFTPAFHAADPESVERCRRMLLETSAEGYARCCEAIARFDLREELHTITAPTLVIAGADDPTMAPEDVELLGERIGDARVVVLPGGAHLPSIELADEFDRALHRHLEGAEAAA